MGVLTITFSETARLRLGHTLAVVNWICVAASLILAAIGVYIQLAVEEYVNMIQGYNNKALPILLMTVGGLTALLNLFGGFLCFMGCKTEGAKKLKIIFLPYVIAIIVLSICIFAAGMTCFAHIAHLREAFHGGLRAALGKYRDQAHIKAELDWLQMTYECCGSDAYTDWFHTAWINEEYLNVESEAVKRKMSSGAFISDDTPFSCCDPAATRPCIHHNVHDNNAHWNYDYRAATTLHHRGCKAALMEFFGDELLINSGAIITGIFFLQLFVLIGVRYLQSAMCSALDSEDPTAPSPGCLCDCNCGTKKVAEEEKKELPDEEKALLDNIDEEDEKAVEEEDFGQDYVGDEEAEDDVFRIDDDEGMMASGMDENEAYEGAYEGEEGYMLADIREPNSRRNSGYYDAA